MRPRRAAVGAALLALSLVAAPAAAERVVAIGDIHGALGGLRTMLARAGLVDAEGRWSGGRATLVQTGDILDRGAEVRAAARLLMTLEKEAAAVGGRVVVVLGNHEAMNLVGEYRDVSPDAYAAFVDERSEKRRKNGYADWRTLQRRRARRARRVAPEFSREVREAWMAARPPGYIEYVQELSPQGELGAWLRGLPVAVQVDDTVFLHGGISPATAARELDELGRSVQAEIARHDRLRRELEELEVILPTYSRGETLAALRAEIELEEASGEGVPSSRVERLRQIEAELQQLAVDSLSFGVDGPLWFRGYAHWADELLEPFVTGYLAARDARRIVVAHTPSAAGRIQRRLGDRVFLIDTGMLSSFYSGGRGSALEISGDQVREIYEPEELPAGALMPLEMLRAQAAAAPAPESLGLRAPGGGELPFRSRAEIEDFLRGAEVIGAQEIGIGITQPLRLELQHGGIRARAVFHDVDEYKSQARLRNRGIVPAFRDSYRGQIGAYRVSLLLGMDNVPPAVEREHDGRRGSAALWIEEAFMERERRAGDRVHPNPVERERRFYDLRVFDNLINNIDRTQENIIYDADWKLWLVDHTRSFGLARRLPNPQRVVRCSRRLWQALRGLEEDAVRRHLSGVLSPPEIKALLKRRQLLVELIEEKIRSVGEEVVLFEYGADGTEDAAPDLDDLPAA